MSELEGIAIVGIAARFPGAHNAEELWRNLRDGIESVTFFTEEELAAADVDPALLADPRYVRAKGVLDGADLFDAAFFGFTPREAEAMDPQHRVFLECAWEALEDAGLRPRTPSAARIGVWAGSGASSYLIANLLPNQEPAGELRQLPGAAPGTTATSSPPAPRRAEPARPERLRPDRLLHLAGGGPHGLPEPARRRVRHGAGRRGVHQLAAAHRLSLSGGRA